MSNLIKAESPQKALGDQVLALIRDKFPQYHPLIAIAELAHDTSIDDPRLKLDCHKTLARYITPELKSVEVKAEIDVTHRRVIVSMFDGDTFDGETGELLSEPAVKSSGPDALGDALIEDAEVVEQKRAVNE